MNSVTPAAHGSPAVRKAAGDRYRKSQIRDRQREANRLHRVMQETGTKLDTVATDLIGKSGRAMLDALVQGATDPVVLADLARGRPRTKIPAPREALQGALIPSTLWSSAGSLRTSTTLTRRSTRSLRLSRSSSAVSRRRSRCAARSSAWSAAPPT